MSDPNDPSTGQQSTSNHANTLTDEGAPSASPAAPVALTPEELREQEIQAAFVVPVARHNAAIHLDKYDPAWPQLFAREEARIRSTLGERALRIEHVGSTSVPQLAAKPIIDIVLVVPDSGDEPSYVPALAAAGYVLRIREPEWHQHRLFKGPDTNINLHVYSPDCGEIDRMVGFREWLRAHPEDRLLYERTKRELAKQTWMYVQNYADAKTAVVEEILSRANASATLGGSAGA